MNAVAENLYPFEPKTQSEIAIHREALHQFNELSVLRRRAC